MQMDRAGWQGAKALVIPENIRLISQPASSPELNPVEHIWEELRPELGEASANPATAASFA